MRGRGLISEGGLNRGFTVYNAVLELLLKSKEM